MEIMLFPFMGSWYILSSHLKDKILLESSLSAYWSSRRMGRVKSLLKSRDPQI
jgi:hypothetical protein